MIYMDNKFYARYKTYLESPIKKNKKRKELIRIKK